jgi:hypothetical protein
MSKWSHIENIIIYLVIGAVIYFVESDYRWWIFGLLGFVNYQSSKKKNDLIVEKGVEP